MVSTGDKLILYTDGWLETSNAEGALFDFKAELLPLLSQPAPACIAGLQACFDGFLAGLPLMDDLTLLVVDF